MAMAGAEPSTGFLGFLSFRRNQVVSLEPTPQDELDALEHFQSQVSQRLASLLPQDGELIGPLLSLPFLSNLLDSLLATEQEFSTLLPVLLARNPSLLCKAPSDKLTNDLLDRIVKSLDLCNAISLSVHAIRHSHRQARIAASCLLQSERLGAAQLARARRALQKFLAGVSASPTNESVTRHSSVGNTSFAAARDPSFLSSSKSISFAVSRNWSAKQQVQAMSAHLMPPRVASVTDASGGLAMAVYTMSSFLVFSMWVLISAIPCQDHTGPTGTVALPPPPPPKQLHWAAAMAALQDKITDELKRKDKKSNSSPAGGLLAEMQAMEKSAKWLKEWVEEGEESDNGGPLLEEDRAAEVAIRAAELEETCRVLEEGLGQFERQVREVFHRVVSSRADVMRCQDHSMRAVGTGHGSSHGHGSLPPLPNGV